MKHSLISILSIAALLSITCMALKPARSDAEKETWKPLFDGKTTKGWHTYGKDEAGTAWKVENGTLHLDIAAKKAQGGGGDLVTDEEFSDFDLQLEWKVGEGANSGIIFYVKEDPDKYKNTFNTGPEMQVLDNEKHPDAKIYKHRAGDLYDLIPCKKETVKPAGEWNKAEIKSKNGKLQLFLNGTEVVSTTLWDENWKKMVAASKFAAMPDFGTFKSGKIALQDHGDDVWYRNIMIKKL